MVKYKRNKHGQIFEDWREPFTFYTFYPKKEDIKYRILSLQKMYEEEKFDLFDHYVEKYLTKIINDWKIFPNKTAKDMEREEILENINTILGPYGTRMIYLFRYLPFKLLGKRMRNMLSNSNVIEIDLNEKEEMGIKEIIWGTYMSNPLNKSLTEQYYKDVSAKEYFSQYTDGILNNLSALSHIGVATDTGTISSNFFKIIKVS